MAKRRHRNRGNGSRAAVAQPVVDPAKVASAMTAELLRSVQNSGYSGGGASTRKNYSRGWEWQGGSPAEDIGKNLGTLRQRSRDLWMNSPIARAALSRIRDNSVGTGLRLQATPNAAVLGLSAEAASEWARRMEWEFELWADSRECDALGLDTFGELQALALLSWLQSGDAFGLLPMIEGSGPYELAVHIIEADRVCDPQSKPSGVRLENGVEIGANGRTVAYWVSRVHPLTSEYSSDKGKFDRIPVRDAATGRTNILHMRSAERPEQRRGVPFLAPVIESLKQLTRYSEAELMAAVVAGLFTVFIKSQTPQSPLGESILPAEQMTAGSADAEQNYEMGSGSIIGLAENEDIATASPGRPNAGFTAFFDAVCRETGAALGIPYEVMMQAFTASYSASRAALLDFWKTARAWREALVRNFCMPVYEELVWEAVLKGRIEAPGFTDDAAVRKAWLAAEWHGPAPGQIDPLKEVQAAEKRMQIGVSTLAREAQELTGTDWQRNVEQLGIEKQAREDAGVVVGSGAQ